MSRTSIVVAFVLLLGACTNAGQSTDQAFDAAPPAVTTVDAPGTTVAPPAAPAAPVTPAETSGSTVAPVGTEAQMPSGIAVIADETSPSEVHATPTPQPSETASTTGEPAATDEPTPVPPSAPPVPADVPEPVFEVLAPSAYSAVITSAKETRRSTGSVISLSTGTNTATVIVSNDFDGKLQFKGKITFSPGNYCRKTATCGYEWSDSPTPNPDNAKKLRGSNRRPSITFKTGKSPKVEFSLSDETAHYYLHYGYIEDGGDSGVQTIDILIIRASQS